MIYTKRFYHDIVASGAQAASPLLFPETVFNAPASHLAAILGITGASYTIVGDGAVGVLAIKMASDLMENKSLEACLIIGAEEADWILCDAYHKWRLIKKDPPIELFRDPPRGTILSEGAGAIVIAHDGEIKIDAIHTGGNFMTDGFGTGFSSNLILNENPTKTSAQIDTIMSHYMGINRYIKMTTLPYDQIHHIDMHPVRARGLDGLNLILKPREIGGDDGWGDLYVGHGSSLILKTEDRKQKIETAPYQTASSTRRERRRRLVQLGPVRCSSWFRRGLAPSFLREQEAPNSFD